LGSCLAIPLSKPVDRANLIALGAIDFRVEDNILYLTMPWADPWSWRLLLRQLEQPSRTPDYRDFAARRDGWLDKGLLDEQRAYWERKLAGVPERPPSARIEKFPFPAPPGDYQAHLTAFIALLAGYTGETDICVGVAAANRHRPDSVEVIGPLANVLGIRVDAAAHDLAREVAGTLLEAMRNQDLPQSRTFAAMFLPESVEGATWLTPRSSADLTLTPEGFEYNPERFTRETVARMAEHFQNLVTTGEMPGAAEREQLALWNRTGTPYREVPVHELIRASDAVAVAFEDRTLTYRELLRRAEGMAGRLQKAGVGPEAIVGVLLERSEDLPVSIVAIWKAGGAYLPLDPAFPPERLEFMMRDSGARVLITQRSLARLVSAEQTILVEDGERAELATSGVTIENLACILYTSGSTGQPKGAAIGHRNLINLIEAVLAETGFGPTDVLLAIATIAFDAAAMELFAPLVAGGRVEIASRDVARDSRSLARLIDKCQPAMMFATPATWRTLVEAGWQGNPKLRVLCGGELFKLDLMTALLGRSRAVWHVYGPTETTVFSTMYRVYGGVDGDRIPIGRPIANTYVSVRDARGGRLPIGISGELWIGGDGVSRGYLNRPELNAQKFSSDGEFRTGDRVRFRADGNIEFLGRLDTMTKVRGNRVEAGEVEAALLSYPGVRAAAVLADSESIAAYLVGDAPVDKVRAHMAGLLPEFMVPSKFLYLEAMPLTSTGKIDRLALADRKAVRQSSDEKPFVAPRTPVEKAVASIFAEVLELDRVAADDDFFHSGGHSLLATQVLARIWEMWKIELPARVLFESPTVARLAARISDVQTPRRETAIRVRPANPPLSFAQQRLWFLDHLYESDRALYNIPVVVRLAGRFDIETFQAALNEVVRRHESLRTNFGNVGGEPVQTIAPALTIEVEMMDRERALAETGRPFDLARDPLIRACVAQTGADEYELAVAIHHIVADGWSFGVLFREINALMHGRELAPLPMQYADFALQERETLTEAALGPRVEYWRKQLAGAPAVLELPADRPRHALQTFRGKRLAFTLPGTLADAVNSFCAKERATPFMVLLAAFQVLLRRYSGETDISVGTPIANRTRVETEGLIGFFVNTLVLRTKAAAGTNFRELLAAVRDTALDAFAHQDVPFQKLVEALQPDRA
jgi:amino acid adenylation domain-containing protein